MKRISVRVTAEDAGQRLDKFLAARSGLSRGACRRAITEGGVWLERKRIRRLSQPVQRGWLLEVAIDEQAADAPEPTILFEDKSILVVAKPAGLATQGTLASDKRNAMGWAEAHTGARIRTVHRLDIGTSGVLVLAKTYPAATTLAVQFKEGAVEKRYLAIGVGTLPAKEGLLDGRLKESARRGSFEVTAEGGVPAETAYRVLASRAPLLLIEAKPHTGRTHQIRVHLSAAGAPLLGDGRYGGTRVAAVGEAEARADRPMLHAAEIRFVHPASKEAVTFAAEPPEDFAALMALIGPPS